MKLVGRDFIGEIVEISSEPQFYKVKIPELIYLAGNDGLIVVDEVNKYWYSSSSVGTYGSFLPLFKGTKVVVRFKNNNLNSGYIDRIFSYEIPGKAKSNHPFYFLLINTPGQNKIEIDDKNKEFEINYMGGKGLIKFSQDSLKINFDGKIELQASNQMFIRAQQIHLNDTLPSLSSSNINLNESLKNFKIDPNVSRDINIVLKVFEEENQTVTEVSNETLNFLINTNNEQILNVDNTENLSLNNINEKIKERLDKDGKTLVYEYVYYDEIDVELQDIDKHFEKINLSLDSYENFFENVKAEAEKTYNDILQKDYEIFKILYDDFIKDFEKLKNSPYYKDLIEDEKIGEILKDIENFATNARAFLNEIEKDKNQ